MEGPAPNPASNGVYFPEQPTSITLGVTQDTIEVIIARKVASSALTVRLSHSDAYNGFFSAPSSVTFAAGETLKTIKITVGEVEFIKSYLFSLSVDDPDQIDNPYAVGAALPTLSLSVIKEDFVPYAEGTFTSEFFEDEWPMTLEYSEATNQYRLSDLWVEGYDVLFTWDGSDKVSVKGGVFKPASTSYFPAVATGYVDPTYGMVWAIFNGENTYDADSKTFTFPITWRVTAGSFGVYSEYFSIDNLY